MGRIGRVAAILGAALVLVPAAAVGGFVLWMRAEVPSYTGTVTVAGPTAPVEILRDGDAVPHIFARTMDDAYFALGWVHAQDRMWQMEVMRRLGAGRLSEVLGTLTGDLPLRTDRMMRTLGLYRAAEASLAAQSPEVRRGLESYAAGVNAWLANRTEALPLEFQILAHEPEPWRPADSLVWGKLMAWQLSGNHRGELMRARLLQRLPEERVRELFPGDPPGSPVTLAADLRGLDFDTAAASLAPPIGPDTASNEWVLAGSATTTGKPILANDPHLGLDAPIIWYLARIETPGLSLAGATVPGAPLHVLGHNGHLAWGFTTTHSDTQDLFVERLDPTDPTRYLTPAGSVPFLIRKETILVRGAEAEEITVRETRHGPVISDLPDADQGGKDQAPPGHVLALAFPGLFDRDTTADALHRLNRARTAREARDALFLHVAPQQNIVFADTAGDIGFLSPALVPVRAKGDGRLPVPGWTGEWDWTGFIPFNALPSGLNPPSGRFVNANNAVVGPDYPYHLAADWPEPTRARRIEDMLGKEPQESVRSTLARQLDILSPAARELLPLMLKGVEPVDAITADALSSLRAWDGRMDRNRPEPLIFEWWLRELIRTVFADELGGVFGEYWYQQTRPLVNALTNTPSWCDDVATPAEETCTQARQSSLAAALAAIVERHGPQVVAWRWGWEHKAPLAHPALGRLPVVGPLFRSDIPTDGSGTTVNRGTSRFTNAKAPFAHVHGAGLRAVYDLSDLGNSRFVIATGQSGNPLSPHWDDFVHRWRDGGTVTLAAPRDTLEAGGHGRVVLLPPGAAGSPP